MEPAHLESLRRFLHRQEVYAHQQRQEIEERLHKLLPSFTQDFPEVEQLELEVLQTLKSELVALLERAQELDNKIEDYLIQVPSGQALSEPVLITLAYLLNALYSCFEDQFQKIARVFENRITNLASWHRELLERMGIEVEG